MNMDNLDRAILLVMQNGIPLVNDPFKEIAEKLRISEDEVISRLKRLQKDNVIRRFGASIKHTKLGFLANALVVWKVPQNRVKEVGKIMSNFREVTHCYERETIPNKWDYNLYTVVHERNHETLERLVKKFSKVTGIKNYQVLYSTREFKRASACRIR